MSQNTARVALKACRSHTPDVNHPLEIDRMRAALDAAGIGVWEYDPLTGDTRRSGAYDAIYGYPQGYDGPWDGATCIAHIHEEDRAKVEDDWASAISQEQAIHLAYRIRRADTGAIRWVEAHGGPRYVPGDTPLRFVGTLADITEQREREAQRDVLLGEMRHRMKNILANVQALALNTGRRSQSIDEFLAAFGGRLSALAQAHDLATSQSGSGASLTSVMRAALEPWAKTGQVRMIGEHHALTARQAVALTLALHELATNAVKYGALSQPSGTIELKAQPVGQDEMLLTWQEHGGPTPVPPSRIGFGRRLLAQALPSELSGTISQSFPPEGARCVFRFPVTPPRETADPPRPQANSA